MGEIHRALAGVRRPGPFGDRRARPGMKFPHERNLRVLFAGVAADPALAALAGDTEACVVKAGGPAETREYRPHLTLARSRNPIPD